MASDNYTESKRSFKNNQYNVIREIGDGNFGWVYLAFDAQDNMER